MDYQKLPDLPSFPTEIPPIDPAAYRLIVTGAVVTPLQLSLDDLRAFPQQTVTADFSCLEGWVAENRTWQGVSLRSVLERACLLPEARYVVAYAADYQGEYNVLLSREEALAPTALLALGREGLPLTHDHGAPVRLQVPGVDCFTQAKWVLRIEALLEPVPVKGPEIALDRLKRLKAQGLR